MNTGAASSLRDDGSGQRLDALLEAAGVGAWESDLARHSLWLSVGFWALLGHDKTLGGTVRKEWTELLHPDDVTTALRARRDLIEGNSDRFSIDIRMKKASRAFEWVTVWASVTARSPDGTPRKLGGVAFLARGAIASPGVRLELKDTALRESRDGTAITDANGFFIFMNPAHRTMFGISATTDITGLHWSALYEAEVAQRIATDVFPGLVREGSWRGQLRGRRIDTGRPVPQEVSLTLGSDGRIICATRDISERLRHEQDRLRMRESLIASQRNEVVHLLTAGVAHDLMNMLGLIQQLSSLIETETFGDPADAAAAISRTVQQAVPLVQERLALGREAPAPRRVDVRCPLTRAVNLFRKTLPETVGFVSALPERPIKMLTTETELVQVALNMLLNAADAVDPVRGRICLELGCVTGGPVDGLRVGRLQSGAQYARLSVTDNGTGLPEDIGERVFEPYVTSKGAAGTGLGMYVIAEIAKTHDGAVAINSKPGEGARVDVYLRLDRDPMTRGAVDGGSSR